MSKDWLINESVEVKKYLMKAEYKSENINAPELLLKYTELNKFILHIS